MNKNDDIPHLIVSNRSDSTQSANEDGHDAYQRTIVTPSGRSLPSSISTIQQQVEMQNFNPRPRMPMPNPQPSFVSSSLSHASPFPTLFPARPPLLSAQRPLNFGLPPISPTSMSFPSDPFSDYDQWLRSIQRSPGSSLPPVTPLPSPIQSTTSSRNEASTSNENTGNEYMEFATNFGVKRRACNQMTRSVSVGSLTYENLSPGALSPGPISSTYPGMFTALELQKIKADKKLSERVALFPKEVKRILVNRASSQLSKERKAQYVSDLEAENATLKTMNQQLQEERIAMENELREYKIRLEGTEENAHILRAWNGQLNVKVSELTNELNRYRREVERLTMQQSPSPNMFHEPNINQSNHRQRNPNFDDQI